MPWFFGLGYLGLGFFASRYFWCGTITKVAIRKNLALVGRRIVFFRDMFITKY